ncbi:MAG TPA: DNA primase, partial [Burkholderiaceae bacterium]|nr:DNA primase [Burkholderiaceae bacterium]
YGGMPDDEWPAAAIPARTRAGRRSVQRTARLQQRAVTPMAKRLLRLLLAHPELVDGLGDQQLEILDHSPHLVLVRDLITLANVSGARHAGALLEAADPDSDLADVLAPLTTELLGEEDLPDPLTEWNDALRRIELDAIKAEQSALVQSGLRDKASQQRYQELTRRRTLLERAPDSQVK